MARDIERRLRAVEKAHAAKSSDALLRVVYQGEEPGTWVDADKRIWRDADLRAEAGTTWLKVVHKSRPRELLGSGWERIRTGASGAADGAG